MKTPTLAIITVACVALAVAGVVSANQGTFYE